MRHKRSPTTRSFLFSRAIGIGAWGLPVLLGALLLFTTGCSSTQVTHGDRSGYHQVNRAAAGETVQVDLKGGRTMELRSLYVTADSTTGLSSRGRRRTFPTTSILKVKLVDRSSGALWGAGIGLLSTLTVGVFSAAAADGVNEGGVALIGSLIAAPLNALLGAGLGAVVGKRESYEFSASSIEVDPSQAGRRPFLPEHRPQGEKRP